MSSRPRRASSGALARAFLGAALLSGCATPEPRLPEPRLPEGPLSLEALVELALENNPDVTLAEARVARARGAIDEALSYYWPVLRLVERLTVTDTPSRSFSAILDQGRFRDDLDFNDPGVTGNFRTGLTGSITLYDGGRRRARAEVARARAASLEARSEAVRRDVALEVARSYYLIHRAGETLLAQESSVETLERHIDIVEARLEEGAATRSELLAVRIRRAETEEALEVTRSVVERGRAGLRALLGLGAEVPIELVPPAREDHGPPDDLGSLVERARSRRFELVEASMEIARARAELDGAAAGYFPEITLFGDFGFDDREPALDNASFTWGLGFAEGLFDALRTPYRIEQEVAALRAALAAGRRALLDVELEVESALVDARQADALYELAQQTMTLAKESLRIAEAEYREGSAGIDRLLDQELALTLARTRLGAAMHDRALSRVALAHSTGDFPSYPEEDGPEAASDRE